MLKRSWIVWALCLSVTAGWSGVTSPTSAKGWADRDGEKRRVRVFVTRSKAEGSVAKRWIGVGCEEVPDILRTHLDLGEDQGLIVAGVVPDSPASRAGLVENDILLEVGGEPIKSREDLVAAVEDAGEEGLELTWLHRGESQTKTIKPVNRPEEAQQPEGPRGIRGFTRRGDRTGPFGLRLFGPAYELPEGLAKEFPEDLRIEIKKEGRDPAQITVRKDNQEWKITEEELDKLPGELRPYVEHFVGGDFTMRLPRFNFTKDIDVDIQRPPLDLDLHVRPRLPQLDVEKRLEQMNRRMEQLFEEMKQLRREREDRSDSESNSDDAEPEAIDTTEEIDV